MSESLSALEHAMLAIVADHDWPAFDIAHVKVTRRENTGVGRFVDLVDFAAQTLPDGLFGAGDHYVEMTGIRHGLFFVAGVEHGRLVDLEIFTCEELWDGEERPWTML